MNLFSHALDQQQLNVHSKLATWHNKAPLPVNYSSKSILDNTSLYKVVTENFTMRVKH